MINTFEVEGLNGAVDANLEFNTDLNIVTGANGSGKTTLLQLIWYLISGQIERALGITFDFVSIDTDQFQLSIAPVNSDQETFFIRWEFPNLDEYGSDERNINYEDAYLQCATLNANIAETTKSSLFFPSFRRIEGSFSRTLHNRDSAKGTRQIRSRRRSERNPLQDAISQLAEARSEGDHRFVASFSTTDIAELVPQKNIEVSEKINAIYTKLSRDLKEKIPSDPSSELQDANSVLEQIRDEFTKANAEEQELHNPLTSLGNFINGIFGHGITVTEGVTLGEENGAKFSDQLSYGQQQMLSFLCYNAFSTDTTIFIDEPELSLHVDWQRLLLPTLLEQRSKNQFFIATHSPFIYANYPDKEFLLGYDRGGEI